MTKSGFQAIETPKMYFGKKRVYYAKTRGRLLLLVNSPIKKQSAASYQNTTFFARSSPEGYPWKVLQTKGVPTVQKAGKRCEKSTMFR